MAHSVKSQRLRSYLSPLSSLLAPLCLCTPCLVSYTQTFVSSPRPALSLSTYVTSWLNHRKFIALPLRPLLFYHSCFIDSSYLSRASISRRCPFKRQYPQISSCAFSPNLSSRSDDLHPPRAPVTRPSFSHRKMTSQAQVCDNWDDGITRSGTAAASASLSVRGQQKANGNSAKGKSKGVNKPSTKKSSNSNDSANGRASAAGGPGASTTAGHLKKK